MILEIKISLVDYLPIKIIKYWYFIYCRFSRVLGEHTYALPAVGGADYKAGLLLPVCLRASLATMLLTTISVGISAWIAECSINPFGVPGLNGLHNYRTPSLTDSPLESGSADPKLHYYFHSQETRRISVNQWINFKILQSLKIRLFTFRLD